MSEHEDLIASLRKEASKLETTTRLYRQARKVETAQLILEAADALAHAATRERQAFEEGYFASCTDGNIDEAYARYQQQVRTPETK